MNSSALRYCEPETVSATLPSGAAHLRVEIAGFVSVLSARLKLTFPLSEPQRLISIQQADGKEMAILTTIEGVEPASRSLIEGQLDRRYFTPRISRILKLEQTAGMWRFQVETHRGPAEFYVRNWRDNATEIGTSRWQIMSVDGGRYEILNLEGMDAVSRRYMDLLL